MRDAPSAPRPIPLDRSRVLLDDPASASARYWTDRFGLRLEELREIVRRVGTSAEAVAAAVGKPYPPD